MLRLRTLLSMLTFIAGLQAYTAHAAVPVPDAEYRMDECLWNGSGGEVIDQTGNGYDGTAINGAVTADPSNFLCKYADLTGNNYLTLDTDLPSTNSWTLSAWVKFPLNSASHVPVGGYGNVYVMASLDGTGDLAVLYDSNGSNLRWLSYDDRGRVATNDFPDNLTGWHQLVWVGQGNSTTLYLDGSSYNSVSRQARGDIRYIGTSSDDSSRQTIGAHVDEVKIFTSALSASEINELYTKENAGQNHDGTTRTCTLCPVAEYRLDECSYDGTSGEVVDASPNGLNATSYNNTQTQDISAENGGVCRAVSLNGNDNYIEVADPGTSLLDLPAALTVSAWIKPSAIPASGLKTIVSKDTNYEFHLDSSGRIYWWWNDDTGTTRTLTSTTTVPVNQWSHIAIRYRSGAQSIFINGQQRGTATYTGILRTNNNAFQIGQDQGYSGRFFDGLIDEVLVFSADLSTTDIQGIYANQLTDRDLTGEIRSCPNCTPLPPLALYHLDETGWGTVTDSSGNNNHGAVTGSVTPNNNDPVLNTNPGTCGYAEIARNTSTSIIDAIDTGLDVESDIGNTGTISFWYKSNAAWGGNNGARQLFDASNNLPGGSTTDKYFFLVLQNNSRLRFGLEDSNDNDFTLDTGNNNFGADRWVHIAVTWDLNAGAMSLYLDGSSANSANIASTGTLGNMNTLFMGDNRSSYLVSGSTGNSANGSIDEIRVYNFAQTQNSIAADMNATHPCANTGINHYEISHDGHGLTCQPEAVAITACTTATVPCPLNDYATGSATVVLDTPPSSSWVGGSTTVFTGSTTKELQRTIAGTVSLAMDSANPAASLVCLNSDAGMNPCDLQFHDAGFEFAVPTQVSCETSPPITVTALRTDPPTGQCIPAFANRTVDVGFWSDYSNPPTGSSALAINGIAIGQSSPGTPVSLNFNGNGEATVTSLYNDAGQLTLNARFEGSGSEAGLVMTGTDSFVVRPYSFKVEATTDGSTPLNNNTNIGTPAWRAGGDFYTTVTAQCQDGTVTQNFAWDTLLTAASPSNPAPAIGGTLGAMTINGAAPAIPAAGFLDGSANPTGIATISQTQYSEVGNVTIEAAASDYMEPGISVAGTSSLVGRFTPDHFAVSHGAPTLDPGCANLNPLESFSYLGQPLSYSSGAQPLISISAKNRLGGSVNNYYDFSPAGGLNWWKLPDIAVTYSDPSGITVAPPPAELTLASSIPTSPGQFGTTLNGPLAFSRTATPAAPFDANISTSFPVLDSDGIFYDVSPPDGVNDNPYLFSLSFAGANNPRQWYGMLKIFDNFGPENEDMANSPFGTFYYDGSDWQANSLDNCTTAITVCSDPGGRAVNIQPVPLAGGQGTLTVTAGPAGDIVSVCPTAPSWLTNLNNCTTPDDSCGTFTFGIYRGNDRIINWKEISR